MLASPFLGSRGPLPRSRAGIGADLAQFLREKGEEEGRQYDIVAVTEAPDDETATATALKVSSLGNVRTATMRAFDQEEIEGVIRKAD